MSGSLPAGSTDINTTVTVLVPTYNMRSYLPACIQSVLDQTYTNWELILIDDGSTDGSSELCDAYAHSDSRIHVIHQENRGVSAARNRGIRAACGSYICFMDSDDSIEPSMLEKMVVAIEQTEADCIACGLAYDFVESGISRTYTVSEGLRHLPLRADAYRELSENRMLNSHCGKLFKTEILKQYEILMDESISVLEDGIFVLDYLFRAKSLYCLPSALYHYRQPLDPSLQKRYHPNALTAWKRYARKQIAFTEHMDVPDNASVYAMLWHRLRGFMLDVYTGSELSAKEKWRLLQAFTAASHEIGIFHSLSHSPDQRIRGKLFFRLVKGNYSHVLHALLLLRYSRNH